MTFWKRLAVWLVLLLNVTVWYGPVAHAGLKETLAELGGGVKTNSAGRYSSSARNVQTLGGMSMRFPVRGSNISLIAINPPGYAIGCGGISAWFGGFSYVNGEQVKQWLTKLGQGAVAYAFKMAIKALCPICEAVLATLEKLAQFAAKLSMDSCSAGQLLATKAGSLFSKDGQDPKRDVCGKVVTGENKSDDMLAAMNTFCTNIDQAAVEIENFKNTKLDKDDAATSYDMGIGNQTWLILRGMRLAGPEATVGATDSYYPRLWHGHLLMNMVGSYVTGATCANGQSTTGTPSTDSPTPAASADKQKPAPAAKGCMYFPTITAKTLWGFMMCGTPDSGSDASPALAAAQQMQNALEGPLKPGEDKANAASQETTQKTLMGVSAAVKDYCSKLAPQKASEVYACPVKGAGGDVSNYNDKECKEPVPVDIGKLKKALLGAKADDGYILYVHSLLTDAVGRIASNQALTGEQIALMDRTSYPVYQLLATAAVYPDAALTSVSELSVIIAQALVMDELRLMSNSLGKVGVLRSADGSDILTRILHALTSLNDYNALALSVTRTETDLQAKLYAHIAEINKRIQNSVLGPNLVANERLASTLVKRAGKLSDSKPAANTPPATPSPN